MPHQVRVLHYWPESVTSLALARPSSFGDPDDHHP